MKSETHARLEGALCSLDEHISLIPRGMHMRQANRNRINALFTTVNTAFTRHLLTGTQVENLPALEHQVHHLTRALARYYKFRNKRPFETLRHLENIRKTS